MIHPRHHPGRYSICLDAWFRVDMMFHTRGKITVIRPVTSILNFAAHWVLSAAGLIFISLASIQADAHQDPLKRILEEMREQGDKFEPDELLAMGEDGTSKLLDFLLPESAGFTVLADEEIQRLIGELNHEQFSRRRHAIEKLSSCGVYIHETLKMATAIPDPETAYNISKIMRNIKSPSVATDVAGNAERTRQYGKAYGRYLTELKNESCWRLIAMRSNQALCAGRKSTGGSDDFLWQSFEPMAKRKDDDAMSLFRPLIWFGDVSSSEWVFTHFKTFSPDGFTPSIMKEIVQTDHVYNETHIRRCLKHLREKGPDVPYVPDPGEVRQAFKELDATWNKTQTFLSYEAAAMDLLISLPADQRRFEIKTPDNAVSGNFVQADCQKKTLTLESETDGTMDFSWKDISMMKPLFK